MKKISALFLPFLLLIVLAFSCSGLGLGMITHHTADMDMSADMSACCGTEFGVNDTTETHSMMIHQTVQIISSPDLLAMLIAVVLLTFFTAVLVTPLLARSGLYMKRWRERSEYFALLYKRLFATGLLHSKVL